MQQFHRLSLLVSKQFQSPEKRILFLCIVIGAIEGIIMTGIKYLPQKPGWNEAFTDSLLLLLFITPVIYLLIFRPMVHYIRDRQRAEEALLESETHLYTLANSGQVLIWTSGLDKKCDYFNQTWLHFTGRSLEQEMGDGWVEGVHPDDVAFCFETYSNAFDRREPFSMDYRMRHHSGEYRWIQDDGTPRYNHKGEFIGYIGHCLDITRQKQAEEKVKISEETFRNIFEHSPLAAAFWNTDARIIYWNKAAERTFGWAKEEVIGRKFTEFFIPEQDRSYVEENIHLLVNNISQEVTLNKNNRKDGSSILCEWHNTILLDQDGKPTTILSMAKDVTEQKRIEQELIDAKEKAEESERLKTSFLANMSHEIRTPLNSIIGFSELLADPDFDAEQKLKFARLINSGGNNLLAVITDIMDFSKIEAGKVEVKYKPFSVFNLLNNLHQEYSYRASEKNVALKLEISPEIKEMVITSDEIKIRQILVNFIGNAFKFIYSGAIIIGAKKIEDFVQFHVSDTGIGIPEIYKDMIFERFRQVESQYERKHGGIGLGLAISKSLTELLGGTIWLESEKDKGSTFYFTVPVYPPVA